MNEILGFTRRTTILMRDNLETRQFPQLTATQILVQAVPSSQISPFSCESGWEISTNRRVVAPKAAIRYLPWCGAIARKFKMPFCTRANDVWNLPVRVAVWLRNDKCFP